MTGRQNILQLAIPLRLNASIILQRYDSLC